MMAPFSAKTEPMGYTPRDMGVRRLCAGEGRRLPRKRLGQLFEQWVGLELIRQSQRRPGKRSSVSAAAEGRRLHAGVMRTEDEPAGEGVRF
jgi:hypothetical protein